MKRKEKKEREKKRKHRTINVRDRSCIKFQIISFHFISSTLTFVSHQKKKDEKKKPKLTRYELQCLDTLVRP